MKAFLICPSRGLRKKRLLVHNPRNTNQNNDIDLIICKENRAAIESSDVVILAWDGVSTGSLFDMGMAFALRKPLRTIRIPPDNTQGKSFTKMLKEWEQKGPV